MGHSQPEKILLIFIITRVLCRLNTSHVAKLRGLKLIPRGTQGTIRVGFGPDAIFKRRYDKQNKLRPVLIQQTL